MTGFLGRGARGVPGPPGADGAAGAPGAAGPSGQASRAATNTPDVTAGASNCDVVWPPGAEDLTAGVVYTIELWLTCERTDTKARRHFNARAIVAASLGGALNLDGIIAGTTINSSTPNWTGAAAVSYSVHTTAGGLRKVRAQGTGPNGATCNWIVSGAFVRQQSGLTA